MSDEDVISRTVEYWFDLLLYSEDFKKVFLFMLHFSHSRRLGMDETVRMIKATEEYKTVSFNELQVNSLDFSSGSGASTLTIEGKYLIPRSEAQKSTLAIYERGINDREEEYKSDNIEVTDKSDDIESYSIAESVKMYKSNRNDYRCKYCNDNIETTFFMLSCGHEYHLRCAENYVTETLEKAQRLGDVKCTVCRTKFSFEDTLMSGLFDFSENIIRKIEKLRLKRVNFLCVECNCKSSDSILDNQFLPYYLTCKNCNRTFCSFCKLSVRHYECTAFEQHLENFLHNYTESLR